MGVTAEQVYAKAKAFVDALAKVPRSQALAARHGHYARDYNTLRKLATEACPDIDERQLSAVIAMTFDDRT
jgi:hypothetical protein